MVAMHDWRQLLAGQRPLNGLPQNVPGAAGLLVHDQVTLLREGQCLTVQVRVEYTGGAHVFGLSNVARVQGAGGSIGVENYQITLGGDGTETASIGERAGPGFAYDEIVPAIERLVLGYLDLREGPAETFLQAYRRLGAATFKAILYPEDAKRNAA